MKKALFIFGVTLTLALTACKGGSSEETTVTTDSTAAVVDTTAVDSVLVK